MVHSRIYLLYMKVSLMKREKVNSPAEEGTSDLKMQFTQKNCNLTRIHKKHISHQQESKKSKLRQ